MFSALYLHVRILFRDVSNSFVLLRESFFLGIKLLLTSSIDISIIFGRMSFLYSIRDKLRTPLKVIKLQEGSGLAYVLRLISKKKNVLI